MVNGINATVAQLFNHYHFDLIIFNINFKEPKTHFLGKSLLLCFYETFNLSIQNFFYKNLLYESKNVVIAMIIMTFH